MFLKFRVRVFLLAVFQALQLHGSVARAVAAEPPRGAVWGTFQVGDQVELDVACSGHWEPVTILKSEPLAGRTDRTYTVRRQRGDEWSFRAPGIVAPCGRGGGTHPQEASGALPLGVYGCQYRGQVAPAMEFALLTASTYRDYDGGQGSYRSDPKTGVLEFVTGPLRGVRAQRTMATVVRILENGIPTGNVCAHNPARNANGRRL